VQSTATPDDALLDRLVWGTHMSIDRNAYAPEVRAELDKVLQRSSEYRSPRRQVGSSGEDQMLHATRVGYERLLVAFADDAASRALAVEYVDRLRPCYEWEGYHDCPEHEASFATEYLAANPTGSFGDYLPLLAAHRWLCTAEAYDYEKRPVDAARSKRAYESLIVTARRSRALLIRLSADALVARGRCHP
jgi:hypothetical protein